MEKIDYTRFSPNGATPGTTQVLNKQWWKVPKAELHNTISAIVKHIAKNDSRRQTQYQTSTRLYGNTSLMGINGLSYSKLASVQSGMKDRITYNVVQSAVDTVVAKMAKNRPRPMFLTSGGDYKLQRRAKKLDKFVDGVFYENDAQNMLTISLRDSAVLGDGVIHVFEHNKRVKWERAIPSELYVDPVEAFYGDPRQLHWVKNVDRQMLIEMFPEKKDKIIQANSASSEMVGDVQNVADQVTVVESWHLPSGPEASDGLHTIVMDGANLFVEDWSKDYFPFAFRKWSPRLFGFWSQGGAEQIQNIQLEVNKILWLIQRSYHLAGTFKIWTKTGSKIVKEHLNNEIGAIWESEEMPQYIVPPVVPPEYYQHLETLKNLAYEQMGVSQLSASSQKPEGLDSGKAIREYNNIETDRFRTIGQEEERFVLDLTRLSVDVAKDIYEKEGTYQVQAPSKRFVQTIDWKDVDLTEDQYIMKMFPVSALPNEPSGRLATIQEYTQAGFIDPETANELLEFPDLERVESLSGASREWLEMLLDKIIDEGIYLPPEPENNLQLAKRLSLQYYAYGQVSGLEENKLEMLRTFMKQVDDLTQTALQETQAQQQPQIQPQAAPQAQPQSDLVQNVPGIQGVA